MNQDKARKYFENQILTAPKEQLLLMLFDGAIRFSEQAKVKIDGNDLEATHRLLIKGQHIMMELISALDKDRMAPDLYTNLVRLYNFVYFRMVHANLKKDKKLVDEAIQILHALRDTWAEAVEKDRLTKFPEAAVVKQASEQMKNISMQG